MNKLFNRTLTCDELVQKIKENNLKSEMDCKTEIEKDFK